MKYVAAVLAMLLLLTVTASAQGAMTYVTDFDYALIRTGGIDGDFVYNAYADGGKVFEMGLMTENGEKSRETWSAAGWSSLFAKDEWTVTVHGTAASLCPYASTHTDATLCPYRDVALVTLTNKTSGVTLANYYMQNTVVHLQPGGSVTMCWGYYGYRSPETLKWDGKNTYMALCDANGKWGVYDTVSQTMVTAYMYDGMSAVYGNYAKVSNGTAWGRLDVSGATQTVYRYTDENAFSVREELREIEAGRYRVFNADNEPISPVMETQSGDTLSYAPKAHTVLKTTASGKNSLIDLTGTTFATFNDNQNVLYLDGVCYAVETYTANGTVSGVALARIDHPVMPEDTVLSGDVNFDGIVDTSDAWLVLRSSADLHDLTARQTLAGDVTGNVLVNTVDARRLLAGIVRE